MSHVDCGEHQAESYTVDARSLTLLSKMDRDLSEMRTDDKMTPVSRLRKVVSRLFPFAANDRSRES